MDEGSGQVLVVVPCLDEEEYLPSLLPRLLREADGMLVVVADGGSCDRSREIVRELAVDHPNLRLLDNRRRIQGAGINLAARRYGARCRWLLRIDAHADYPEGFLRRLKAAAAGMKATSVVVPMVTRGRGCFQKAAAAAQNSVLGTGGAPHRHRGRGQWVEHGHHALFDLDLFMAVGGYDENFAANEDAELDRRLLAAGGRIWLEPDAAITYYPRRSAGALFRQYRNYGKGRARNLRRHPAPVKLRQLLPLGLVPSIVAAFLGLALLPLHPAVALLMLPLLSWIAASAASGLWLGWRSRSACAACSGFAAMVMHLGWALGFTQETISRRPADAAVTATSRGGADGPGRNDRSGDNAHAYGHAFVMQVAGERRPFALRRRQARNAHAADGIVPIMDLGRPGSFPAPKCRLRKGADAGYRQCGAAAQWPSLHPF